MEIKLLPISSKRGQTARTQHRLAANLVSQKTSLWRCRPFGSVFDLGQTRAGIYTYCPRYPPALFHYLVDLFTAHFDYLSFRAEREPMPNETPGHHLEILARLERIEIQKSIKVYMKRMLLKYCPC